MKKFVVLALAALMVVSSVVGRAQDAPTSERPFTELQKEYEEAQALLKSADEALKKQAASVTEKAEAVKKVEEEIGTLLRAEAAASKANAQALEKDPPDIAAADQASEQLQNFKMQRLEKQKLLPTAEKAAKTAADGLLELNSRIEAAKKLVLEADKVDSPYSKAKKAFEEGRVGTLDERIRKVEERLGKVETDVDVLKKDVTSLWRAVADTTAEIVELHLNRVDAQELAKELAQIEEKMREAKDGGDPKAAYEKLRKQLLETKEKFRGRQQRRSAKEGLYVIRFEEEVCHDYRGRAYVQRKPVAVPLKEALK